MTTLVLGSSGLVGRELVTKLTKAGNKVVACDVSQPKADVSNDDPSVTYVTGDMTRLDQLLDIIQRYGTTEIAVLSYIMGPLMSPEYSDYLQASQVNVVGVTNVFEAARLAGVRRVVFVSTVGTYGPQSLYGDRAVSEDDILAPRSLYGRMKALNESMADRYATRYGIEVAKVRPSSILGPGSTIWPGRLIDPLAIGGTGTAPYTTHARDNIVSVDDLTSLFTHLLTSPGLRHDTYLATGHNVSMGEVVSALREILPDASIDYPAQVREPSYAQMFDNSRAVDEFGWELRSVHDSLCLHLNYARREAGLDELVL